MSRHLEPSDTCILVFLDCCICGNSSPCRTDTFFMRITCREQNQEMGEHVEWSWRIPLARFEGECDFEYSVRFPWEQHWDVLGLDIPNA